MGLLASDVKSQVAPQVLALTNANVIDGVSDEPIRKATVIVRDGKIASVGTTGTIPAGATVLDLNNVWVLPGLIDAHVHLADLAAARVALSEAFL